MLGVYVECLLITAQNFMVDVEHPWIKEDGEASDKPIDSAVLSRMKQFRAMNKLKKLALKVGVIAFNLRTNQNGIYIYKLAYLYTFFYWYENWKLGPNLRGLTFSLDDIYSDHVIYYIA